MLLFSEHFTTFRYFDPDLVTLANHATCKCAEKEAGIQGEISFSERVVSGKAKISCAQSFRGLCLSFWVAMLFPLLLVQSRFRCCIASALLRRQHLPEAHTSEIELLRRYIVSLKYLSRIIDVFSNITLSHNTETEHNCW